MLSLQVRLLSLLHIATIKMCFLQYKNHKLQHRSVDLQPQLQADNIARAIIILTELLMAMEKSLLAITIILLKLAYCYGDEGK